MFFPVQGPGCRLESRSKQGPSTCHEKEINSFHEFVKYDFLNASLGSVPIFVHFLFCQESDPGPEDRAAGNIEERLQAKRNLAWLAAVRC